MRPRGKLFWSYNNKEINFPGKPVSLIWKLSLFMKTEFLFLVRLHLTLARISADLNVLKVMDLKVACMVADGEVPVYEASLLKVISNEVRVSLCNDALQMLGDPGLIKRGSAGARRDHATDTIEHQLRESVINLFGGGSNDIQRDIMATHGLGLPR